MSTELIKRCTEVSVACNDSPITGYFRQLIAEKTGIVVVPDMPKGDIRKMICSFEALMFKAAEQGEFIDENPTYVIKHHFAGGVYAREMHIPQGHVVVGKIHRNENLHFLSKGRATVITEEGGVEEVCAGQIMKSPVGVKRLLITHEDTVWTVLHATRCADLELIEDAVIAKDYSSIGWENPPLLDSK